MPIEALSDVMRGSASAFANPAPWVRRNDAGYYHVVGALTCTASTVSSLVSGVWIAVPFMPSREWTLSSILFVVTTAATGSAEVGLYGTATTSGNEHPGARLAHATGINIGTTGEKVGSFTPIKLVPGRLYWAALVASASASVRTVPVAAQAPTLGRATGSTGAASHLSITGTTLPSTGSVGSLVASSFPALYLQLS